MTTRKVTVISAEGLHMRPAGLFSKAAKAHSECEVTVRFKGSEINAKSVMSIMLAGINKGCEIEIAVNGGNEDAVLDELCTMIETDFGRG